MEGGSCCGSGRHRMQLLMKPLMRMFGLKVVQQQNSPHFQSVVRLRAFLEAWWERSGQTALTQEWIKKTKNRLTCILVLFISQSCPCCSFSAAQSDQ